MVNGGAHDMLVKEYTESSLADAPCLFSSTRSFAFQSRDGRLVHRILERGPRGFTVIAVRSTGHAASFVEDTRLAVTMPLRGSARVRVSGRQIDFCPGDILTLAPSERDSLLSPDRDAGSYESYTVIAPSNWAHALPDETRISRLCPSGDALRAFLDFAFAHLGAGDRLQGRSLLLAEALLEDAVLDTIAISSRARSRSDDTRLKAVFDSACEVMAEEFSQPISILDVARRVGVGERTLQKAFRAQRGRPAREYLAELRLNAMRQRLLSGKPGISVTTAALDAGFCHLGRCSAAYKARYGELPSATLRRSQGRIPVVRAEAGP